MSFEVCIKLILYRLHIISTILICAFYPQILSMESGQSDANHLVMRLISKRLSGVIEEQRASQVRVLYKENFCNVFNTFYVTDFFRIPRIGYRSDLSVDWLLTPSCHCTLLQIVGFDSSQVIHHSCSL